VLDFGDGRTATLELLYGDGIFFADPVRAQLRTTHGATVGKTPMANNIVTFCPSSRFCWVFLSGLIPIPWRLIPGEIAWSAAPAVNPYFPESDETPSVGFAVDWTPWAFALGMAVFTYHHALGLAATLVPLVVIAAFTMWLRHGKYRHLGETWYGVALSILLWLVLILYELVAVYLMVALRGFPFFLFLLALACSLIGANRITTRLVHRKPVPLRPASGTAKAG
jgi:hypothetical protein